MNTEPKIRTTYVTVAEANPLTWRSHLTDEVANADGPDPLATLSATSEAFGTPRDVLEQMRGPGQPVG